MMEWWVGMMSGEWEGRRGSGNDVRGVGMMEWWVGMTGVEVSRKWTDYMAAASRASTSALVTAMTATTAHRKVFSFIRLTNRVDSQ